MIETELQNQLEENIIVHQDILKMSKDIVEVIQNIQKKLKKGGKILFCGNGGSAADAQHLAAEFIVRLRPHINRNPIPALTLAQDTSTLTACGNDYSFDDIFLRPFKALAKKNKHTFISTGMSTKEDIDNAINIFKKYNCSYELMHCVSTYPMRPEDANLITINQLKKEYNCDVGYSGHENGVAISIAATILGITSLERHITLDRAMYGSDQSASLELSGMRNLVESINKILLSIGEPSLGKIIDDEKQIAKKLRAHIKN